MQAMVGLMSINGTETSGPTRMGNPIVDIATGLFSCHRHPDGACRNGRRAATASILDMTLHDCGMALLHPHAANYFLNGKRPKADRQPAPEPRALFEIPDEDLRDLRCRRQ